MALSTPHSPCLQSRTPPASPRLFNSSLAGATSGLEQVFQKLVHVLERIDAAAKAKPETEATEPGTAEIPQSRELKENKLLGWASKVEYKTVNEIY